MIQRHRGTFILTGAAVFLVASALFVLLDSPWDQIAFLISQVAGLSSALLALSPIEWRRR